jgi:hypothetical protein
MAFRINGLYTQVPHVVVRVQGLNKSEKFHVQEFFRVFWDFEIPMEMIAQKTLMAHAQKRDDLYFIPLPGKAEGDTIALTFVIQKIQSVEVIVERNPNLFQTFPDSEE